MHDIRQIRDNPAAFDTALARRGLSPRANEILAVDENWRELTQALQTSLAARNDASKAIGAAKAQQDDEEANRLMAEVSEYKAKIPALEAEERLALSRLNDLLASIPNLADISVPIGADENENVVIHVRGDIIEQGFEPREHHEIGPALGLDFETAQKVAGARFAYLRGGIARLSRALGQFMLDLHTGEFGYQEVAPPVLVRDEALYGTGQLPKFAEDQFRTTDGRWLIPTAEVSLTNMVRDMILVESELPIRLTALTPCFRSEAGAAGRDTRGMIRQHQFEKVELVSIVRPEDSDAEHERMTSCAEAVLEKLELPFRRMLLCTGDMGFSAQKTFDLEVWLPGQQRYREISSCSNCGDFQARRMNARFRREGEKGTVFVHTLNGSGLAVGRALVAVIENYQKADGSISVPTVLQPYMGGLERITAA
ncbi:serine--tRNA ligase [Aquisediminimonas profunda]|uniref:serine--tRNA ligase n=1 Tax=Aquisediminimonas profunda TaxID=1550733 RepID=UPI001C62C975|nr:serine--tRNA ligase [Aquisediminimonas profunda]